MMQIIKYPKRGNWEKLAQRPVIDSSTLEKSVENILNKIKKQGDKALIKYTRKFDGVKLKQVSIFFSFYYSGSFNFSHHKYCFKLNKRSFF